MQQRSHVSSEPVAPVTAPRSTSEPARRALRRAAAVPAPAIAVGRAGGATGFADALTVGVSSPGDAVERDADRAAEAMVRGRPAVLTAVGAARAVHRDPPRPLPAAGGQGPAPGLGAMG